MQLQIFSDIINNNLSVRKVEELVRNTVKKVKPKTDKPSLGPDVKKIQDKLSSLYETRVKFTTSAKGKGKIVINYYSNEDLNRIIEMLDFE